MVESTDQRMMQMYQRLENFTSNTPSTGILLESCGVRGRYVTLHVRMGKTAEQQ